jgi:TonB family protein
MGSRAAILFQTIEAPPTPWSRWVTSFVVHVVFAAFMVAIPMGFQRTFVARQADLRVQLVAPRPAPPPVKQNFTRPPLPAPKVPPRPFAIARVAPRKIETPKIEPPKIETPRIEPPKIETSAPKPDLPAPPTKPAVKTGLFAENHPAPAVPAGPQPSQDIRMGGFGNPDGARPSETSTGKGPVAPKTGAFDLPSGPAAGRGGDGRPRAVASAGFGDAAGGGGNQPGGAGQGQIRSSGFGDYQPAAAPARAATVRQPVSTPVEIISKPKPVYTAEARERRVEGEVQLDVLFHASGQIEVLRVIRGLGLGLDEAASAAASQIRFRPGTRDGNPVDMRGVVHIVFQLS